MKQSITATRNPGPKRDFTLDTIKALATICVVLVHAANLRSYAGADSLLVSQCYNFFSQFAALGVPLFFVVSGYLASMQYKPGRVGYFANLQKKTMVLAVPYCIWVLIYFVLERVLLDTEGHDQANIWYDLFWGPLYAPLWFIRDLYLLTFLLPIFKRIAMFWAPCLGICVLFLVVIDFHSLNLRIWYLVGILIQTQSERFEWMAAVMNKRSVSSVLGWGTLWTLSVLWPVFWLKQLTLAVGIALVWVYFRSPAGCDNQLLNHLRHWVFPASFSIFVLHGKLLSLMQIVYVRLLGTDDGILLIGYFILPAIVIALCITADAILRKTPVYSLLTGSRV